MELSPQTKLNKQVTFDYKSFHGSDLELCGFPHDESSYTLTQMHDHISQSNGIPLKQLISGSQQDLSDLKDDDEDKDNARQHSAVVICIVCIIFAAGITLAMIIHICMSGYLVLMKGVLVSDHERCTALGQQVLDDHGSSVDAAITATMCLGVVHPHVSGMGGGGVMLVHDLRMNETRVIHFQGTAPKALKEEMLQNVLDVRPGLQVGVPAMLSGLFQAHSLYGRLSWADVVSRVADVARDGVNVSQSLFKAILKVKGQLMSQRFRDQFFPDGKPLQLGSALRIPGLAAVLEANLSNFYNGNLSQEMEEEVRANGGVLSREDISGYSAEVAQPLEGLYHDFKIKVPPPPSIGAALISVLNVLESLHLNKNNTEQQMYHWVAEALKAALVMASGLADPKSSPSVRDLLSQMLSKSHAEVIGRRINDSHPSPPGPFYAIRSLQTELRAGQVLVMGPDDLMVSVASSLNGPFGSRIVTQSGIILNSLILDFSRPNQTPGQLQTNPRNRIQPGKRPLSSLMPTIVVPAQPGCGLHLALSSSDARSLSTITQVLSELCFHEKTNGSRSLRRLCPELQPNRLLVDSEFPEDSVQFLLKKGHMIQRVAMT